MAMPEVSLRQLLEAGVHFGHQTRRWNPKMAPYIFGVRNSIHIIDLQQTVPMLQQRAEGRARHRRRRRPRAVRRHQAPGAAEKVADAAKRCGQYYVNHRWLGGMLTNWKTISDSIKRLSELDEQSGAATPAA